MARFDYLKHLRPANTKPNRKSRKSKAKKKAKKKKKLHQYQDIIEQEIAPIYIRKTTAKFVWDKYRKQGGDSLTELVEDLLLAWSTQQGIFATNESEDELTDELTDEFIDEDEDDTENGSYNTWVDPWADDR